MPMVSGSVENRESEDRIRIAACGSLEGTEIILPHLGIFNWTFFTGNGSPAFFSVLMKARSS